MPSCPVCGGELIHMADEFPPEYCDECGEEKPEDLIDFCPSCGWGRWFDGSETPPHVEPQHA